MMATLGRFSKAQLVQDLREWANRLEKEWRFDRNNGWAQLRIGDIERAVEYGHYRNMLDVAASIRLLPMAHSDPSQTETKPSASRRTIL